MVDKNILLSKATAVKRHIKRVIEKRDTSIDAFLNDIDRQESILFNMQMAIQNCVDIAAHIISDEGFGVPGSTNEMFYLLEENGYIKHELAEKMVKAVGFRNLMVHEYGKINLKHVFMFAHKDIDDLNEYVVSLTDKISRISNTKS